MPGHTAQFGDAWSATPFDAGILDAFPVIAFVQDAGGRFLTVNRQWELAVGMSREEARGKTAEDVFPQHIGENLRRNVLGALASGVSVELEETVPLPDGTHLYRTVVLPLRDAAGNAVAVCGLATDVTATRQAEERLRGEEEKFRLLVESIHDYAIYMLDPEGRVVSWNPGAELISGYRADEILGKHISLYYPPEELAAGVPWATLEKAAAEGRAEEEGWRLRKDGSRLWASIVVTALRNADGSLRGFARITRDRTAQKEAEKSLEATVERVEGQLRRNEEHYRHLIENALDIIAILSAEGAIAYVSPAIERVLGYKREQVTGTNAFALIHPEDAGRARDALRREAASPGACGPLASYRFRAHDGSWKVLEILGRNLLDVPAISGVVVSARDVTESALAEERLRESQRFIESVADTVPDALYVYDLVRGRVVYLNRPDTDFLPARPPELGLEELRANIHPDDAPAMREHMRELLEAGPGHTADIEVRLRGADGAWRWVYLRNTAFKRAADGTPEQIAGTARDITARKRAAEVLEQTTETLRALAAKLLVAEEEERKALSRELHDDLNQRLAVIAFAIGVLARDLPPSPDLIRAELASIESRVSELSDDVRRMAHLLRPSILDDLGLVPALRSYCTDFSRREHIGVRLTERRVAEPLPPDATLTLYRVAQEALRNVAKHSGSRIAVVRVGRAFGDVWLFVRDFGAGFDPAAAGSKGGLGIISMQERVRLARGQIAVRSKPRRGTRIAVRIPTGAADT